MEPSREEILVGIAKHIDELEQRRELLLQEADQVDKELHFTRSRHRQLLNENAPISILPYEILAHIFLLCQHNASKTPVELVLSHVSSIWRKIALGTALLWVRISVNLVGKSSHPENVLARRCSVLQMYLTRSCEALLSIRLQASGMYEWLEVLNICSDHLWRCQELALSIHFNFSTMEAIRACLRDIHAQNLKRLSVRIFYSPHNPHELQQFQSIIPNIMTIAAPSLTFVRLSGVSGPLQPPMQSVTTLSLDGLHMADLTLDQARAFLQSAPQLVNLSLSHMNIVTRALPSKRPPLLLPHLRHLRIGGTDDEDEDNSHILMAQLPLSQLETLVLREIPSLGDNTFPNVHTLSVSESSFPSTELVHTVDAFPSLVNLDCDLTTIAILLILSYEGEDSQTRPEDIPTFWPGVKTLCVRAMDRLHPPLLIKCIYARARRGVPFESVFLDSHSRRLVRTLGVLEELGEIVHLEEHQDEPWPPTEPFADNDDSFWE